MKHYLLCLLSILYATIGMAQSDAVALAQLKNFARNVHAFNRVLPQEKVYLHFDNTEYYRGETIWFKAYVIRTDLNHTNMSGLSPQFRYDQSRQLIFLSFPRYTFPLKKKGIRQTYFQGYNRPQVFQMNDYSVMPPDENDHRRTLYWIPNVATDSTGQACVTLWNSADCRKLIISAESITPDGKPMLYKNSKL